jgi:hypothetical protein
MYKLYLKSTEKSPEVRFVEADNCLSIKGKSLLENPMDWYQALLEEIDKLIEMHPIEKLNLQFDYFNTASAKQIYQLLKSIIAIEKTPQITWLYEAGDEDMKEAGEDYQELLGVKFLIKVED